MATETEEIESFDDFIALVDGDSVITPEVPEKKTTIFSPEQETDLSFLDNEENPDPDAPEPDPETDDLLNSLGAEAEQEEEEENVDPAAPAKTGRKKIDKSGLVETFSKLFEEEVLVPFEDDKPLEEYSIQDWKDLIKANIEDREATLRENTPKEFFEALPKELQHAAKYVAEGGTDLKGLFSALAQSEEVRSLDPKNPKHQATIVREYLNATMEDRELAEEQLQEWEDAGLLERKAAQLQPKLEKLNEKIVAQKIQQQEELRQKQIKTRETYLENVTSTLKAGELSGLKITSKVQKELYDGLTQTNHKSITGRPTNELGKLLEDYQFSENPRYDLIAEALWLLKDRDGYMKSLSENFKKDFTEETVKTLKTEQGRRLGRNVQEQKVPEQKPAGRKLTKPRNIFGAR